MSERSIHQIARKKFKEYFKNKSNIFLTGKAGSGKSSFIKDEFKDKKNIVFLSSYNSTANNIGGETIYKFFELRKLVKPVLDYLNEENYSNYLDKEKIKLIKNIKTIVIDEVSGVRADVFDFIDEILKSILKSRKPFGGVQVILLGDIFQLGPIFRKNEINKLRREYKNGPYFFDSKVFKKTDWKVINLYSNYRQTDNEFIKILDDIRTSEVSPKQIDTLNRRVISSDETISGAIELVGTNSLAGEINEQYLNENKNPTKYYDFIFEKTKFGENFDIDIKDYDVMLPLRLKLKVGAEVVLLRKSNKFPKSTKGIISQLHSNLIKVLITNDDFNYEINIERVNENIYKHVEVVDEETGEISIENVAIATISQFPLQLCYAMTIHKAESLEFDKVVINTDNLFQAGQLYTALSRCKSIDGLYLKSKIELDNLIFKEQLVELY